MYLDEVTTALLFLKKSASGVKSSAEVSELCDVIETIKKMMAQIDGRICMEWNYV